MSNMSRRVATRFLCAQGKFPKDVSEALVKTQQHAGELKKMLGALHTKTSKRLSETEKAFKIEKKKWVKQGNHPDDFTEKGNPGASLSLLLDSLEDIFKYTKPSDQTGFHACAERLTETLTKLSGALTKLKRI
jgi:hypothetical protein